MAQDREHEAMVDACIKAAERVMRVGSPELQAVMRVLLYIVAGETAERSGLRPKRGERRSNGDGQ